MKKRRFLLGKSAKISAKENEIFRAKSANGRNLFSFREKKVVFLGKSAKISAKENELLQAKSANEKKIVFHTERKKKTLA